MSVTIAVVSAAERIDRSHSWIWPEGYEAWFGTISSILVFALLVWKAGPFIKKGLNDRTQRVQTQLDAADTAVVSAERDAATVRAAKGDIGAERERLLAAADEQAAALLADGRGRLDRDIADLQAKAAVDIEAAMGRTQDELRAEIARLSSAAAERVIVEALDDATQQRLIESFIERVGASGGVRA
jgi:F-type H+-transporting ATPase subunit b